MNNPKSPSLNRRQILSGSLASAAALLSSNASQAQTKPPVQNLQPATTENAHVYQFPFGELQAAVISDNQSFNPNALDFIPVEDKDALKQALTANYQSPNGLEFNYNILVLRHGDEIMLFDTGSGNKLQNGLAQLGIKPEQITHILISHAHGDHINGLLTADKTLQYPNAQVHISQKEHDFWYSENPDFSQAGLPADRLKGSQTSAQNILNTVKDADKLHTFQDEDTFLDGAVTTRLAPGHTPGHTIFELKSADQELVHIVDLAHSSIIQFYNINWGIAFDINPTQAIETRRQIFAELAQRRVKVLGYHLPFPALGHIAPLAQDSYHWTPTPWKTNP